MDKRIINSFTVSELGELIKNRDITCVELAQLCLDRIENYQSATNAFIIYDAELTINQAKNADALIAKKKYLGPMHGIPFALKDNYMTKDYPTTACSKVLDNITFSEDAPVVDLLRKQGAVLVGKTNMHEWAYGATNKNSTYGATKNPWNTEHITGGSSGGSGAAVAAKLVPVAFGSDTGGSVRIPSAGCGVSGFKPTYGVIDKSGVLPLSWSLDAVGPLANTAHDLSILLHTLADNSKFKHYKSYSKPTDCTNVHTERLKGLTIGIPQGDYFQSSEEVSQSFTNIQEELKSFGVNIKCIPIDGVKLGFNSWKILLHSEASAYHKKYMSNMLDMYSSEVRCQLEVGRCLSSSDYLKAQQHRVFFTNFYKECFSNYKIDLMAMPTLPVTAPNMDADTVKFGGKKISVQNSMTYFAWIANFTGFPAVSIPCGFGANGLPIGLMLMGNLHSDYDLLSVAEAYQQFSEWHNRTPSSFN